ncbi:MAG: HAD family hydrolase [Polyangiaceae bacterium]|jgi:cation transport ATPase
MGAPEASCAGCGQSLDPLRAGHVAIFDGRFHYFCRTECRQHYAQTQGRAADEEAPTESPPAVRGAPHPPPAAASVRAEPIGPSSIGRDAARVPLAPRDRLRRTDRIGERALAAFDGVGIGLGLLAPAIVLLGSVADVARLPLLVGAWLALALRVARVKRDPADPHPLVVIGPTAAAVAAACWGQIVRDPRAVSAAVLAGVGCVSAIAIERLVARARVGVQAGRDRIERALDVRVHAIEGDDTSDRGASEVRPGEPIAVMAGELVGVDAIVTAGEARVVPWLDARGEVVRREGDPVVAGARVISNRLRMTTTWSGRERAWVKLLSSPSARIDVAAPTARALRHAVERGMPAAAGLGGVLAFASNATTTEIMTAMAATAMAFGAKAAVSFAGLHFARAHLAALRGGIVYKDARAFEKASTTDIAVLSARGTVLLGEPEIVAFEAVAGLSRPPERSDGDETARVLSLAAGAETASSHPFAGAILRAARTFGVRPDHVRNATVHAGLGITALASSGERLVVGGRAIMLEQKIGVATADGRVSELEAQGRSVLLVALGDRVIGLIALQDGLRAGARAAVQMLLDARIEPVLLSGEARDTCETIGRALDIDHVRPEVLPADRGAEVRALAEGGSVVAVIGHPASDDGAMGAADVAVAMGSAGGAPGEWAIALASDDVRDAAEALAISRTTRGRVWFAIGLGASPGLIALLAIGFGAAPPSVAPLASLLGALAVAVHARESARLGRVA